MSGHEILEDDFGNYDKNLHVNFHLNNQAERKMLDDVSKDTGLSNSAFLRYIIIKSWKDMKETQKEVK